MTQSADKNVQISDVFFQHFDAVSWVRKGIQPAAISRGSVLPQDPAYLD